MNSKERVLTAVNLAEPDRVPIDLLPNRWVEERLHRDLGTHTHRELLERLCCDVVDLRGVVDPIYRGPMPNGAKTSTGSPQSRPPACGSAFIMEGEAELSRLQNDSKTLILEPFGQVPFSRDLGNGVRENLWGWRQKTVQTATGPEEQFVEFALDQATTIEELQQHRWPSPDWFDFSEVSTRLDAWQDFAVMASGPSVFQHPTFLRRSDNLLMDMAVAPEMAHWLMDQFTDFYVAFYDRMLTSAQGKIDILRTADDMGMQHSLFISPEMFRTFVKPRVKRLVDLAHSHDVKFMFHSCGAIRPLIDDLIEIGVDILDPLQAAAEGMEPQGLKETYGKRICLHGGICTQYLLPNATPEEVRSEVKRRVAIFGKGGGYILSPCHVLQNDVPTANIVAMVDAALEVG
jgi:uroporphyrinogen decarboxylase